MAWNGADLISETSAKLGDTTSGFKSKILIWMNDGIKDIASRHNWTFLRVLGKKTLTIGNNEQELNLSAPSTAASAAVSTTGGVGFTAAGTYAVKITYFQSSTCQESLDNTATSTVTTTNTTDTIDLTSIPVSADALVTARKIYLQAASGKFFYHSTISDNTTASISLTVPTVTDEELPTEHNIRVLDGDPYFQGTRILKFYPLHRLLESGGIQDSSGQSSEWSQVQEERLYLHPKPSSALELCFYYFRIPKWTSNSSDSLIDLPGGLKPDLERYIIWRGYEYRDRDGQESKLSNYENMIDKTISRKGSQRKIARRVRDVVADSDGYLI